MSSKESSITLSSTTNVAKVETEEQVNAAQEVEKLISLIPGLNETAPEDLSQKPEDTEGSTSKETVTTLYKKEKDVLSLTSNTSSLSSRGSRYSSSKKQKSGSVSEPLSSSSMDSKGNRLSSSNSNKRNKETGMAKRNSKKNMKRPTKSAGSSRHSSPLSRRFRESITTLDSISSARGSSILSRVSRLSRLSAISSQDYQFQWEDLAVGLRKAKKSTIIPIKRKEMPKEDDILHGDEENEPSELEEYEDLKEDAQLTLRNKILDILKDLPDINDISDTSIPSLPRIQWRDTEKSIDGSFVTPVTSSYVDLEAEQETDETTTTTSRSMSTSYGSDDTLMNLPELSSSEHELFELRSNEYIRDSISIDIARQMTEYMMRDSYADRLEMEAQEQRRIAYSICLQFMDDLIVRVVDVCEEESVKLLRILDKYKLWKNLKSLVDQLKEETAIKEKLERLTTEHFMRKKRYAFIMPTTQIDAISYQRFQSAIVELDRQLEMEETTNQKVQAYMFDLQTDLRNEQNFCDEHLNRFEQIVRETLLVNDSFEHLENMVDTVLTNMSMFRNEVSDMRIELLYAQHRLADLINKEEALDDLGSGLRMREYLSQQSDTQVLILKIDERNAELKRLHMRINYDVHALAHLKGKEYMNRRTHSLMNAKLTSCMQRKKDYRKLVYEEKVKHNGIVKEIIRLKSDGSLLHYPPLLRDFDITVNELRAKRETVEKLRNNYNSLLQRIQIAEKLLESIRKTSISVSRSSKLSIMDAKVIVTQLSHY